MLLVSNVSVMWNPYTYLEKPQFLGPVTRKKIRCHLSKDPIIVTHSFHKILVHIFIEGFRLEEIFKGHEVQPPNKILVIYTVINISLTWWLREFSFQFQFHRAFSLVILFSFVFLAQQLKYWLWGSSEGGECIKAVSHI